MKADTEALLNPPALTPEPGEPPDPNVWMLPPEIVEACMAQERAAGPYASECRTVSDAIWHFCFGELPTDQQSRAARNAIFAGRASGSVLLIRRAP